VCVLDIGVCSQGCGNSHNLGLIAEFEDENILEGCNRSGWR
jgi:hypothetical protein